jgi:eukaryotic-like serine/threonine-protein kinase
MKRKNDRTEGLFPMAETPAKSETKDRGDEDRLIHALIGRGLLTREEVQGSPPAAGTAPGTDALLNRLVQAGLLTAGQAKRVRKEVAALVGQQIPGYQFLEKLGQGSNGVVYKAKQLSMDRLVAVKVLHPKYSANPALLARHTREARVAAKLSHNNIVQAIDVGSAGSLHFFVMELVEGKTIQEEITAGKVFREREAVEIIVQIAQALAHAARRGLVHRDVKPANIVLTPEGIAKLADLGMARTAADDAELRRKERGLTIGTPYYISPEQVRAEEDIDTRSDLYSLGATLYHMVTGRPPFEGSGEKVFEKHLHQALTPPDHINQELSGGIGEVVEVLMAKDRDERYQTPDDAVIDLECLLAGQPPKLARQRIEANTLAALTQGVEESTDGVRTSGPPHGWLWISVLGGVLALSLLLNLILVLR